MKYKLSVLLFVFVIYGNYLKGSDSISFYSNYRFIEIKGHSGVHIYTGESLKNTLSNGYGALEVRYGWQSSNPYGWQSQLLYPAYGFGWYSGFIGNPELLGSPGAIYGFISFPLLRHKRHKLCIEPALGLSYDLKPYDPNNNKLNDAIGSRINVYFNLCLEATYGLNREMDLLYGLDLTHFSNGRMFRPNAGLNMAGINIGIRYHFNGKQNNVDNSLFPKKLLPVRPKLDNFKKAQPINIAKILVYSAGGLVQNTEDKGTNKQYGTFTSFVEYQYLLNTKSAFAVGLDYFYDSSIKPKETQGNCNFFGTHIGYDFLFWKLSLRMQVGTYLHKRGFEKKGNFFFRPALKYHINKNFFTQIGLKTGAGFKADWVEFGAGIAFKCNKK